MNKNCKRIIPAVLAASMVLSGTGCGNKNKAADTIVNGGFEEGADTGKWVGWTREDAAFNARGITDQEKLNGAVMEKEGNYYFSGIASGTPAMRGTLTSDTFKLSGNGYITFKMGAGKNNDKVYVEFFEKGKDKAIAKVVNSDCDGVYITDHLITKIVDLKDYIGKEIYIKVTDNDDGDDYAYVNLDAFHMCKDDDEVKAAEEEYKKQLETYGEKPFEEDETSNTIVNGNFETGDMTGWKILEGKALTVSGIVPTSQMYWNDRSVYGEGEYYFDGSNNGAIPENYTGAIRSTKFTLGGDGFISFMIGAASKNCYVALCDANTDEELIIKGNDYFSDPGLALTLLRTYMDASEYIGRVVYIKVVDANDGGGFAFMNVDDFRVSLTKDEVAALETEQFAKVQAETYTSASYDDLATLKNYYSVYPYPVPMESLIISSYVDHQVVNCGTVDVTKYVSSVKATCKGEEVSGATVVSVEGNGTKVTSGFDKVDMSKAGNYTVTYKVAKDGKSVETSFTIVAMDNKNSIANGGFESGNLAGWKVLTEKWGMVDGHATGVISAVDYWNEKMPYNQAGNFHLDGWNTGIDEPETWAIQSTNFTLAGSGYISVRMGGHAAAVHVYKADGTEIGYYTQNRFNDANFPNLAQGGSWADMGTYVMDLSAYVGQELYITLCDEAVEGWSHAFFDEVVTYYEAAPSVTTNADVVADGGTAAEVKIPWQLATNLK